FRKFQNSKCIGIFLRTHRQYRSAHTLNILQGQIKCNIHPVKNYSYQKAHNEKRYVGTYYIQSPILPKPSVFDFHRMQGMKIQPIRPV
ncbi:hypothetical protein RZN34_27675, partial [Klebsiella pneumoniae]